jgi:manganese/zinc/iron transport system permease protein
MIVISALVAAMSAILGHLGAILIPQLVGFHSTNTAGMMATMAGVLFLVAALFAPRYGVVAAFARRVMLSFRILAEDVVGLLYRTEERSHAGVTLNHDSIRQTLICKPRSMSIVLALLRRRGDLVVGATGYGLTEQGRNRARALVRSHRLWEQYLVSAVGVPENRLHSNAEQLEHYTDNSLRIQLDRETAHPTVDPHGAPIPTE